VVIMVIVSCSFTVSASVPCNEKGFVRYLAGIEMLRNSQTLPAAQQSVSYRQLVKLTGVDAHCAASLIRKYHNRPEQWKKFYKEILDLLEPPPSKKPVEKKKE
jgi:hypothetical protein